MYQLKESYLGDVLGWRQPSNVTTSMIAHLHGLDEVPKLVLKGCHVGARWCRADGVACTIYACVTEASSCEQSQRSS